MRHFLIAVLAMADLASACVAATTPRPSPFLQPACVADKKSDMSGRTWQMTGVATNSFANVRAEFYAEIKKAGYAMLHEIPMDESGTRMIAAWKKHDRHLILMLWPMDGGIGFAWGETTEGGMEAK